MTHALLPYAEAHIDRTVTMAAEERGKFLQQQQKENYVCDYTS